MLKAWQQRPLESIYPFVWLDAIHYKMKENGRYESHAIYTVLGLNMEGKKEILGLYISENEGANFWLSVITDLNNRGLSDILIACVDGLKGFPKYRNAFLAEFAYRFNRRYWPYQAFDRLLFACVLANPVTLDELTA